MAATTYDTVIGLEIHVQPTTASKAFCRDENVFGAAPNTHISPISLAHPGTLPRLNRQQVYQAIRLGLSLGCTIATQSTFDRKSYFYADLPKGYQITQDRSPICLGGILPYQLEGKWYELRIHHIHIEEDAGKLIHPQGAAFSQLDLNRAGAPLLEIVTEPDLRSAEAVDACMSAMRRLVRYLGVSEGDMEKGQLRCDVNVSLKPKGTDTYGTRCEIKNVNSMRYARRAIAYEVARQSELLNQGEAVDQQTLTFDPATNTTSPIRSKEDAHDYRYFPEPDLPPLVITEQYVEKMREMLPALPWERYRNLTLNQALSDYDATLIINNRETAEYFDRLLGSGAPAKAAANLLINQILPFLQEKGIAVTDFPVSVEKLTAYLKLIEENVVAASVANQHLFPVLVERPDDSPDQLADELGLIQTSDDDELTHWIEASLDAAPDKVKTYRKGKKGLLGFFMGDIMRRSGGKADPNAVQSLLRKRLEEDK